MLDEILACKRTEIERLDLSALKQRALDSPAPRDFVAALTSSSPGPSPEFGEGLGVREMRRVRLIAELKRASPSRGLLAPHIDLIGLAGIYAANGAAALSVLTDEHFFLGRLETLRALRFTFKVSLPLLRKDFILAPAQVYESRAAGADAVLLIAAALPDGAALADLHALALDLGLTPLVEVHNLDDLGRVLSLPDLRLVGINNRDLRTFHLRLDTTARLRPHIPSGISVVSESGIATRAHAVEMAALGVDAILVGEALVTAPDIGVKVRELSRRN
jgi:indole-3-glycerol phosphate synthase